MQHSVILASQPYGLGLNETLLPQYLKQLGYATHAVGKVFVAYLFSNHKVIDTDNNVQNSVGVYLMRPEEVFEHISKFVFFGPQ